MKKYIDATALKNRFIKDARIIINAFNCKQDDVFSSFAYDFVHILDDYPAADVRENVRAYWIVSPKKNAFGGTLVTCSHCNDSMFVEEVSREHFCRNCGAIMNVDRLAEHMTPPEEES